MNRLTLGPGGETPGPRDQCRSDIHRGDDLDGAARHDVISPGGGIVDLVQHHDNAFPAVTQVGTFVHRAAGMGHVQRSQGLLQQKPVGPPREGHRLMRLPALID